MKIDNSIETKNDGETLRIIPGKSLKLSQGGIIEKFLSDTKLEDYDKIIIDFVNLENYDSTLVIFTSEIVNLIGEEKVVLENMDEKMKALYFRLKYSPRSGALSFSHSTVSEMLEASGNLTIIFLSDIRSYIEFTGNLFIKLFVSIFSPRKIRWEDFPVQFMNSGVSAVPIVFLITMLLGLISGYQGAIQLQQFGADMYIADLVGVSITRELSPLMVAIIVAGRSGSAFAAEIGTMKVSEEIDALKTLGFDQYFFLILPRVIAVTLAIPLLTLIGDAAGVFGGGIAAISSLDITISGYVNQLGHALTYSHIFTGLSKSIVFGFFIAAIGCHQGMKAKGGAGSVGRLTTTSVVTSIFAIIIIDSVFTFIFQTLGI